MSRYIDADAYIKYCEEHWIPLNFDAINSQPTADVAPVVHGEWKYTGISEDINDMYMCSNCKMFVYSKKWNYCPNCGADMRGENNELHK